MVGGGGSDVSRKSSISKQLLPPYILTQGFESVDDKKNGSIDGGGGRRDLVSPGQAGQEEEQAPPHPCTAGPAPSTGPAPSLLPH